MSLKKILGIEGCTLTDVEITRKIQEAQMNHQDAVEFNVKGKKILVKLNSVSLEGMMKDSYQQG